MFHGCAGIYNIVEFEVLEPATITFPEGEGHLLIMNRAPISLYSFKEEDRTNVDEKMLVILDTIISNSLNRGLLEVLRQSPIERFHIPLWLTDRRTDTSGLEDLILTRREVESLCNTWGADMVISLEKYSMDVNDSTIYYTDDPTGIFTQYYEFSNEVKWNVYIRGNPKPYDSYTTRDTVFFTSFLEGVYQFVPSTSGMISQIFHESGSKFGHRMVPVWIPTSRAIYKGKGDSLRKASRYTRAGNWNQAYQIWEELLKSEDSTTVARSYNNMAVFHELEDDLDSASLLINNALNYDTLEVLRMYKDELDTRILNREEVLKQVIN